MHLESRTSWEKLAVELELLSSEDPASLVQILVGLNGLLWPHESMEWTARTLNFLTYDLMSRTQGMTEAERLEVLHEELFTNRAFQMVHLPDALQTEQNLLLKPVLELRAGSPVTVALIYLHLAAHLDLPAYLVQLKHHYLIKWIRGGKVSYIDLSAGGQILGEEQLVATLQRHSQEGVEVGSDPLSILPNRKLFWRYMELLAGVYEKQGSDDSLHLVYNILLKVDPQNSRFLGRRALLRHRLGLAREALSDLKHLFAFIDHRQAPYEIRAAYADLSSSEGPSATSNLLH